MVRHGAQFIISKTMQFNKTVSNGASDDLIPWMEHESCINDYILFIKIHLVYHDAVCKDILY